MNIGSAAKTAAGLAVIAAPGALLGGSIATLANVGDPSGKTNRGLTIGGLVATGASLAVTAVGAALIHSKGSSPEAGCANALLGVGLMYFGGLAALETGGFTAGSVAVDALGIGQDA